MYLLAVSLDARLFAGRPNDEGHLLINAIPFNAIIDTSTRIYLRCISIPYTFFAAFYTWRLFGKQYDTITRQFSLGLVRLRITGHYGIMRVHNAKCARLHNCWILGMCVDDKCIFFIGEFSGFRLWSVAGRAVPGKSGFWVRGVPFAQVVLKAIKWLDFWASDRQLEWSVCWLWNNMPGSWNGRKYLSLRLLEGNLNITHERNRS